MVGQGQVPPPLLSGAVCGAQGHPHSTHAATTQEGAAAVTAIDRSLTAIGQQPRQVGGWQQGQGTGEDDPPLFHTRTVFLRSWVGEGGWMGAGNTAKAKVRMSALSHTTDGGQ